MNHHPREWSLQEAKAKFSEVVRRAREEGPQTVTVHGKAAVTITRASNEGPAVTGTGADLVAALRACPFEFDIPEFNDDDTEFRPVDL